MQCKVSDTDERIERGTLNPAKIAQYIVRNRSTYDKENVRHLFYIVRNRSTYDKENVRHLFRRLSWHLKKW
jgi:hypothetical protein